ncbi:MAG: tetraacyldisaccharide 4'-kinase [Candidatus Polarisedimenticolaceae bacterium]|nr:tetraacyldisaccharide 4'-kinase [Candidatus Polarisedimenticolaceae bacterium]
MKSKGLEHYWYSHHPLVWLLLPLSALFFLLSSLRRTLFRLGLLKSYRSSIPIIIVGNISVGGTGKTPLVVWLCQFLRDQGFNPGIINRGYQGEASGWPQQVTAKSDARLVGDEAVLLAQRTDCPVVAGPKRIDSVKLLEQQGCDIIVSDDGLQHYALQRDIEIAVVDGERRSGNGFLLPAGPLREGVARLQSVDLVVCNGGEAKQGEYLMQITPSEVVSLSDPSQRLPLAYFAGKTVTAVAGIGNPARFFTTLKEAGIEVVRRVFPDHHRFSAADLEATDNPLLMTEKDAVKCKTMPPPDSWYLVVAANFNDDFTQHLQMCVNKLKNKD